MSKRIVVVGSATAVAGLVLGASIVFGPPAVTGIDRNIPNNIGAPSVGNAPGTGLGGTAANIRAFDYTSFEEASDGELRRLRIRADSANLKRMGITELVRPRAEINLGSQRAITITADQADMRMEDGTPRAGEFTGNVVISLFQAPAGRTLVTDPDDPAHKAFIQQRIYLDEATHFSVEDDRIDTRGPVHLTSPQVDFFGEGLKLAYNTQRQRIEQLLISRGRYLIFNPEADSSGFEDEPDATTPDEDEPAETPGPSQFYRATFEQDVVVRDGIESELAGQSLQLQFSLGTEAVSPTPTNATSSLPAVITLADGQLAQLDFDRIDTEQLAFPLAPLLPVVVIPDRNKQRSLFSHEPQRDIVVTWTGEMFISPLPTKPSVLKDDEDVHVTLTGDNAYAQTTRNDETERLETQRLEYLISQEKTTAVGNHDNPVRIRSEALGGDITGKELIVRQQAGTATIFGPGQLTYTNEKDGKQLTLDWANRLDLELFTEANTPGDNSEPGEDSRTQTKILGVKTATFDGGVTARHPDFDLDADKLTIAFEKPDKRNNIDNSPASINAMGNVIVNARGDDEDERFAINAQRLTIDLSRDTVGESYASAMRALGGVRVERPGSVLTCNRVEVALNPPIPDDAQPDSGSEEPFAQISSLLAVGDVRANLDYDDRRIDIVADQLVGDVENDKLTLSSNSPRRPAEIVDIANDRKLAGQLVVMDDRAEILTISGPGSLATKISDPERPDAGIEDAFLNVRWTGSMMFNNVTGQAEFIDGVRSESRRSTDTSELTCDRLDMLFSPDYRHDGERLIEDEGEDAHERQIRSAHARGNVKFMAAAWDVLDPQRVTSRLRLEGPALIFTNRPAIEVGQTPIESVVVEGNGRMVLEDYRTPEDEPAAEDNDDAIAMTGRGATLFVWEKGMTLNALTNTATLVDGVQMVHQPHDEEGKQGEVVQLDCGKLVADLTDTGGLSVWLNDEAPDAQVRVVTADNNVRLMHTTRAMRGDHLKFTAETQQVELTADDGRDVLITDQETETTTRTNKLTWDLVADVIELDEIRGGVAPLE